MRSLIRMKEEVEEHSIKRSGASLHYFGDKHRLRSTLGKGEFHRPHAQAGDLLRRAEIEEIPAVDRPVQAHSPGPRKGRSKGFINESVYGWVVQTLPERVGLYDEVGAERVNHKVPDAPFLLGLLQDGPRPQNDLFLDA
ncbi:MAG: hypothetical protein A4E57_04341 [Syntrophorhabdaceae bacterium PtaU1.Bin034]|nr:MAG: hypothetical protein A4E57_04341 [Syntrophorhabdaceae bacterium PtaU1.Bin034]